MVAAMNSSPNHLNYTATAKTNAMGPTGPYNFVTDSSNMDLGVQVILPLWVKAQGFAFEDTLAFDFQKEFGKEVDMIDFFRVTMVADNGIPLETKLQVYFTGPAPAYTVVDSLFKDDIVLLDPATVNASGKVTVPKHMSNMVEYNAAGITKLKTSKNIIVRASVNTPVSGTGFFKYYSYYGIDYSLSAKANFRINPKNL
jgi:hypothetical protein